MTTKTADIAVRDRAREMARDVLSRSSSFGAMPLEEKRQVYLDLVEENIGSLSRGQSGAPPGRLARGMLEDFEGYDPGLEGSVDAFEDLVDSVDFPKFVGDLLKSVFDANLTVMKSQTDDYIRLLREATKTSADFIKTIREEDAFAYLVEQKNSPFNMTMEKGDDGEAKMTLTHPDGEPVDMDDNQVKAKIVEAKIAMAREHRAALREVILMGVTRLVVDKGEVEAGVEFTIKSKRESKKSNSNTNTNVNTVSGSYGGGLGSLFGGPKVNFSNVNTNINVRTSNQSAVDDLTASLKGKVNIRFKSDYFKMDNFLSMYGDGGIAALRPAPQQGAVAPAAAPTS